MDSFSSHEGWNTFIQTPPQNDELIQYEFGEILQGPLVPPQNCFIPRSPSSPQFLNPIQDPTMTLEFLGLEQQNQHDSPKQPPPPGPEIVSRRLYFQNIPIGHTCESFKKLFDPAYEIRTVEQLSPTSYIVEFFDLRNAIFYRHKFSTSVLNGYIANVRYAPPLPYEKKQKPPNNGTLVIFHLPPDITSQQLDAIFSVYGQIRQIRGTPFKPSQRFVEFWDTRDSQKALVGLNGQIIGGNKISVEFSLPGGFRRQMRM